MLKAIFMVVVLVSVLVGTSFILNLIAEKFPNSFLGKLFNDDEN